jgi:DNA-directed RNA polymerase subunit RPC12/RpoP
MKLSKTVTINYKAGHSYQESWETDGELHCPHCGKREVWVNCNGGDYYVGEQYLCAACGWTFYMPELNAGQDEYDEQRKAKLFLGRQK